MIINLFPSQHDRRWSFCGAQGHFSVYEEHFEDAVTAACDWFIEHLKV
jgi:hypothetical protein